MKFKRTRPPLLEIAVLLWVAACGLLLVAVSMTGGQLVFRKVPLGTTGTRVVGALVLATSLVFLAKKVYFTLRVPIVVDETGLRLCLASIRRFVPWSSISTVILEPYPGSISSKGKPRLVLVPEDATALGVPTRYRNTVDGRSSILLVSLNVIRESEQQVVAAFTAFAGAKFLDATATAPVDPHRIRDVG